MPEEIKNLIEKIQQEGIKAAEDKAKQIEGEAQKNAQGIAQQAKSNAEKLISEAKDSISKMEQKQKTLLTQAGRDLLLLLRKEINTTLQRIINQEIKNALNPESLSKIITHLIKDYSSQIKGEIVITLNPEDLEALKKSFLHKLQEETKKGITLKSSDEIAAGFSISFDAGKSEFDFSDKAIGEFIGSQLKPKLAEILKA